MRLHSMNTPHLVGTGVPTVRKQKILLFIGRAFFMARIKIKDKKERTIGINQRFSFCYSF